MTEKTITPRMFPPGRHIQALLGLESSPVAVFFISSSSDWTRFEGFQSLSAHRYCQALMKARHGESVCLKPEELHCPAAAAAFGFRPLPEKLACGQGLVEFGIVRTAERGRQMFESMSRLPPSQYQGLALSPLEDVRDVPDVVVLEASPEPLMWLLLAYFNLTGLRVVGDTAILQATCVDSTVIPFLSGRLNFSFGCYGCRDATDLAPSEALVGFPGKILQELEEQLVFLAGKAMPHVRLKGAYHLLQGRDEGNIS